MKPCFLFRPLTCTVVYCFLPHNPQYELFTRRFVDTMLKFPGDADHQTLVVSNGSPVDGQARAIFGALAKVNYLEHDNSGWDIGCFIAAAKHTKSDFLFCCGSNLHFWNRGWLARIMDARALHGPGLYGSSSSFEISPHLNTTGFGVDAELLRAYPFPVVSPQDRYDFEVTPHRPDRVFWRFVHRLGKAVRLVTWDGEWEWPDWRAPPNIFRRGHQGNMLAFWYWADKWAEAGPHERQQFQERTDRLTDPHFNLAKRSFI